MKNHDKYYDEPQKKGGGFFGKFIACLLGFLFGILATVGGIAGVGWYVGTKMTIKDGVDKVNSLAGTDIDVAKYITDEYSSKTLIGFAKDLQGSVSELSSGSASLSSYESITPYARTLAETLVGKISDFGLTLDTNELMTTAFSDMSEYLKNSVYSLELGPFIGEQAQSGLLAILCYGVEDEDYVIEEIDGQKHVKMLGDSKPTTVADLLETDYQELFRNMTLESLLTLSGTTELDTPIVRAVAYGEENVHYELVDTIEDGVPKKIVKMLPVVYRYDSVADTFTKVGGNDYVADGTGWKENVTEPEFLRILPASGEYLPEYAYVVVNNADEVQCALKETATPDDYNAYKNGEIVKHRPKTVGEAMSNYKDAIANSYLKDIITINGSSPLILQALQETKISELQTKIQTLKVSEVYEINASSPLIMQSLKDTALLDIGTTFTTLKLGEVIEIGEDDTIMRYLADSTLETVSTDAQNLKVQQIFEKDVYLNHSGAYYYLDSETEYPLYLQEDGNYYTAPVGGTLHARQLTGQWKYLLTDKATGLERDYRVTEMNELITNMTDNIQKASLNALKEDGILTMDASFLSKDVLWEYVKDVYGSPVTVFSVPAAQRAYSTEGGTPVLKTKIGELTIQELTSYVDNILSQLS